MRSLSDYLNIEDTVKLIKEFTKVPFFNEGNLFDLVVKKELQPIVYFDGYGSIFINKERSLYPEDFGDEKDISFGDFGNEKDISFENISNNEQLNYVKGYFYVMFGEKILRAIEPTDHFQFKVKNLIDYKAIPNTQLPNKGLNSKYDVYRKTLIYAGDFIMLSTYDDTNPIFNKNDVKFYVLDIINMLEKNGYYSADDKQPDNPANDKDLTPKDSAYCLIAVLKDLLLDPDISAYHFKNDSENSSNKPSQTGLASYIDEMKIFGIKRDNINIMFQDANKKLKDIKKKS